MIKPKLIETISSPLEDKTGEFEDDIYSFMRTHEVVDIKYSTSYDSYNAILRSALVFYNDKTEHAPKENAK